MKKIEDYIISVPDFPKPGILFRDITGILNDADGLKLTLDALYKAYNTTHSWKPDAASQGYDGSTAAPNVNVLLRKDSEVSNIGYFALPMSAEDVLFNPNLGSNVEGVHVDVRSTYSY